MSERVNNLPKIPQLVAKGLFYFKTIFLAILLYLLKFKESALYFFEYSLTGTLIHI